ncbi:DUF692 domain-containing protein [Vibrio diazotrophicus]|uniref:MNIO family bufferin maturase n=1 Tax=Vibrio diazotrophicus TaxID=685 RepID=UPI0022AFBBC2|nr:DUF692 domain-containing protein [Vibrio diazotrophicus]MCZ4373889.1 DUF692 domain-containing protein [Vibrio diazotrophicus]
MLHNQVGVGLRSPHINYFVEQTPQVSWLEIHSENYFSPHSVARNQLRSIRKNHQISCHGIGLSLGSVQGINTTHLQQLKALIDEVQPLFVSDHLSWSENGGHYFNDLLPLPYTEEALEVFCRNVLTVQDAIKRPILIENPSSYLQFNHSTITEWEFLVQVQQRTECRLLLDLNNVHVSAFNHGFSSQTYIDSIPAHAVDEIHLAGFSINTLAEGEIWIDTHSKPVSAEVWQLYQNWCEKHGSRRTLIEWDLDIPDVEVLLAEANKASEILTRLESMKRKAS